MPLFERDRQPPFQFPEVTPENNSEVLNNILALTERFRMRAETVNSIALSPYLLSDGSQSFVKTDLQYPQSNNYIDETFIFPVFQTRQNMGDEKSSYYIALADGTMHEVYISGVLNIKGVPNLISIQSLPTVNGVYLLDNRLKSRRGKTLKIHKDSNARGFITLRDRTKLLIYNKWPVPNNIDFAIGSTDLLNNLAIAKVLENTLNTTKKLADGTDTVIQTL